MIKYERNFFPFPPAFLGFPYKYNLSFDCAEHVLRVARRYQSVGQFFCCCFFLLPIFTCARRRGLCEENKKKARPVSENEKNRVGIRRNGCGGKSATTRVCSDARNLANIPNAGRSSGTFLISNCTHIVRVSVFNFIYAIITGTTDFTHGQTYYEFEYLECPRTNKILNDSSSVTWNSNFQFDRDLFRDRIRAFRFNTSTIRLENHTSPTRTST